MSSPHESREAIGGIRLEAKRIEVRLTRAAVKSQLFPRSREATRIGRFVVLERVGMGGMGVVYAAYDPQLDRRVALKVMRDDVVRSRRPRQQALLLREARSMAKLSHPNVVAVYDVGTVDDQVFLAMEFVPSQTLRQWLSHGHPVEEILRVFVEAGRGLAGAHAAGLIHRDFKPENVLVPAQGAVRVTDFGLARAAAADERAVPGVRTQSSSATMQTKGAAGTPAYMAPEQMRDEAIDARVDQWAFCLALYEALAGHRPFEDADIHDLARGQRVHAPPLSESLDVPTSVRDAVMRGLSYEREGRFADMDAVLAALRPRRRSSRWAPTLAGITLAGGLAAFALWSRDDACPRADDRMQGVWDRATRGRAEQAVRSASAQLGPGTWERVAPVIDAYADDWLGLRQQSCRTADDGELSAELLDLRMGCLDTRHAELSALTQTLLEADATVVAHAVEAVARLTPLGACLDPKVLRDLTPPPAPAAVREASNEIRANVQRARALRRAGKATLARDMLAETVAEAERLDEPIALVEAWLQRGRVRAELADREGAAHDFDMVIERGAKIGYLTAVAEASVALVDVVGVDLARHDAGLDLARMAALAVALGGDEPLRRAQLRFARGRVLYLAGRADESLVETEAGLDALEADARPRARLERAVALRLLAKLALAADEPTRTTELATDAIDIFEALLGSDHPEVGDTLAHLAAASLRTGEAERAKAQFQRVAEIQRAAYGNAHPALGRTLANLGSAERVLDNADRALQLYRESVAILEASLGHGDPRVASLWVNIGGIETDAGRLAEAETAYARGVAGLERSVGREHPQTALALANLARLALRRGDPETALQHAEAALQIRRDVLGPDHIETARSELTLGEVQRERGERRAARASYEAGIATLSRAGAPAAELAEARADLAALEGGARLVRTQR